MNTVEDSFFNLASHDSLLRCAAPHAACRWRVVFKDQQSKKHLQIRAAFVVVATGLHSVPHVPSYPVSGWLQAWPQALPVSRSCWLLTPLSKCARTHMPT